MIPVRLGLRNFMSYTDVHDPLLFEGIHVACLSGDNGAGKSSLLDAITWALWGYSRAGAGSAAHLIHVGRTEMEVDFEFRLAGEVYRVIRKWTARGGRGSGTAMLDLAVQDGEGFRSISGNTIRETEAKIVGLLRMSYTTFTNSAFILQNKADAFTTRTPAERKQVLADILELAEYDWLQERARDEMRRREARHQELQSRVREADEELQSRPRHEADRQRLEEEIAELDQRLQREDADLRRLQEEETRLTARSRELTEAEARLQRTEGEVRRQRGQIEEHQRALAALRKTLEEAAEIEQGAADLARTRAEDQAFNEKLQALTPLSQERSRLDAAIASARARLETDLKNQQQQLGRHEADARRLPEHEQALKVARREQQELSRCQTRQAEVERTLSTAREEAAELRGANDGLRKEMHALKERIDTIQTEPICPICRSQLDPPARERLTAEYTAEGKAQRARFDENQARAKHLDGMIAEADAERAQLASEVARLTGAERRLAVAEQAVETARAAQRELDAARKALTDLQTRLERGAFADGELARLREVDAQIEVLGYSTKAHQRVREELKRLTPFEERARELAGARQTLTLREEAVAQTTETLASWERQLEDERKGILSLREQVKDLPALRERVSLAQRALAELRRDHTAATSALGEVRQRLRYLDSLQEGRAERLRELEEVLRERGLFSDLATAFGKNGIQAMLIETAIPEIQDEANRLLQQMTNGRMNVELRTQRDRASGEGQIETLDIVINDLLGSRPYEMYSGGEAFRVNFALRIALSRLLARRAGARLETLVIDEGFGSQDQEGRDKLVEAIKSIEDEFAMILVITHLDDIRDRFPIRIEVRKGPEGSVLNTEWVA